MKDADLLVDNNLVEFSDKKEDPKSNFVCYLEMLKGEDRSYGDLAKAAEISRSAMYKMAAGKYMPSRETIRKLTSEKANPQGGVTYEELMNAAGYITKKIDADIEIPSDGKREIYYQYERDGISQVYTNLVEKGFVFRKENEGVARLINDLTIDLIDQPIEHWMFDFKYWTNSNHAFMSIDRMLGEALMIGMTDETKLTFIVNDHTGYQRLKRYDHKLSYRGELSVVFYDYDKKKFVEEVYLSNYYEGDRSREVYLV